MRCTDDRTVTVGASPYEKVLAARHVRPMDFTGKPLKGFVYVTPPGEAPPVFLDTVLWRMSSSRRLMT